MSSDIPYYQSIPELGIKGRFNTPEEFDKIGFPKDLKGKKVLDIACNNGAYLIEAFKRGADYITGVDIDPTWTHRAREALDKTDTVWYLKGEVVTEDIYNYYSRWKKLKHPKHYDLIFCLSLSHLVPKPNELVNLAIDMLSPEGLLILEINDRLQEETVVIPRGAVLHGTAKDNRSVYHIRRSN